MAQNQKQPAVTLLTDEQLAQVINAVQEGFNQINERLDALDAKIAEATAEPVVSIDPAKAEARTRRAAHQALKGSVTRPAPRRRGA